jgi:glycosyltransferase involved in cell wall biosynthesis
VERVEEIRSPGSGFAAAVRRLRRSSPRIVHVHLPWPHANPWLPAAARLAGAGSVVATEHLLFPHGSRREELRKRLLAPLIDVTIAVSRAIARTLTERWGYRPSRVVEIPNGVDARAFAGGGAGARARGRARLGLDDRAVLIGSVGRLEAQKNFESLVRAAAKARGRCPALAVAIAGEGSSASALRDAASTSGLGERLLLPGRVEEIGEFLAALDLFVLPSLWEGMPLSLLEAMAMGVPAIATATPGAEELLGGEDPAGVLVPPGDDESLAAAISALLEDGEAARALGRKGAERTRERHDAGRLFERLVAVYERLAPRDGA